MTREMRLLAFILMGPRAGMKSGSSPMIKPRPWLKGNISLISRYRTSYRHSRSLPVGKSSSGRVSVAAARACHHRRLASYPGSSRERVVDSTDLARTKYRLRSEQGPHRVHLRYVRKSSGLDFVPSLLVARQNVVHRPAFTTIRMVLGEFS